MTAKQPRSAPAVSPKKAGSVRRRPEEREFYLRMSVQAQWKSRELERQYRLGAFERAVLSPPKVSAALTQMGGAAGVFKDAYSVEFLNLAADHTEVDLHRGRTAEDEPTAPTIVASKRNKKDEARP